MTGWSRATTAAHSARLFLWLGQQWFDASATKTFRVYWKLYGGWKALATSPYLYVGLVVALLCWPSWVSGDDVEAGGGWAQSAVEILPSLLGFSMGGMAIMLAFSTAPIFSALTQKGSDTSLFLRVVANFFHFILVQTIALIVALISKTYQNPVLGLLGFWAMTYAALVALATAGQLLQTARVFNKLGGMSIKPTDAKADDKPESTGT